jgi:hypothetical protein
MTAALMHVVRACALAAVVAVSGCASTPVGLSDETNGVTDAGFEASLRKCRKLQPGRLNKRMSLPPTSLRVAQCLRKLGWQPDGSPLTPPDQKR